MTRGARVSGAIARIAAFCQEPVSSERNRLRLSLGGTAAVSLAAHAFSFFNFIPQHDALIESFWQSLDHVVGLGRFLLPVYMYLRGYAPMPWVAGMLSILFLGLSVYFISRALRMDTRAEILLMSGFLSANICVLTLNSLFQFCFDAYMCSLLFACWGVWLISGPPDLRRYAGAMICFFISVGIYAAFITVSLCLLMILVLREVTDSNGFTRELGKKIAFWAAVLALAAALYLLGCRISLSVLDVEASTRKTSVFSLGMLGMRDLAYRAGVNYYFFLAMQFLGFSPVHHADYLGVQYGLAASALAVLCIVSFCRRHKGAMRGWIWGLYIAAAALFPFVARLVPIMTGNGGSNQTMFAQYLVFPLLLWLFFSPGGPGEAEKTRARSAKAVTAAALLSVYILLGNILFSNEAYTLQKVLYDRAMYHTGQVVEDLQDAGYDASRGDRVIVSGTFSLGGDLRPRLERFERAGIDGFYDTSITYSDTFRSMARILGFTFRPGGSAASVSDRLADMPSYPEEGYLQEDNGLYIIKLS